MASSANHDGIIAQFCKWSVSSLGLGMTLTAIVKNFCDCHCEKFAMWKEVFESYINNGSSPFSIFALLAP